MQLSVSNISWDASEEPEVLALLAELGVQGIEVAPTKLWPDWEGASPQGARDARSRIEAAGFTVPALQSILFGRPDIQVFGDASTRRAGIEHIGRVAALAAGLGARVLVFGSPKNRSPGTLSLDQATKGGVDFFRAAGEACAPHGVDFCLEPNPPAYGCDFLAHWAEVESIVERIDHPHVGIHLDIACMDLAGDDSAEAIRRCDGRIRHFHVTEPQLGDFSNPVSSHREAAATLAEIGYAGWLSIEMRRSEQPLESIRSAVRFVQETYA